MTRGTHWWNEPPWWAWVAIVVCGVFLVVGLPFAVQRGTVPASQVDGRPPTPTPATTPAPATTTAPESGAQARRLVVIGDALAADWPALLADRMPDLQVSTTTVGAGGYVTTDPADGRTLGRLVEEDADLPEADVVVLAGSSYDVAGISDQVARASADAIHAVADRAPNAVLVVVGPVWASGDRVPAGVRNDRDVIRLAAQQAGVRFADPVDENWLGGKPALVTGDGRPTEAGVAVLADRVQPLVTEALAR